MWCWSLTVGVENETFQKKATMSTAPPSVPVLELRDVSKSFGPVQALRTGTIVVNGGSIHALIGENGAGKSTVVKIIGGLYRRDSGELRIAGAEVDFSSTAEAKEAGIAVIYQEPTLFPDLTVAENIFVGRQPLTRWGLIDRAQMRADTRELFSKLGVPIDPDRLADGLSIADQQIIEIAKAISMDARLLIMDEPTAALSGAEVARLFGVARSLRDRGAGIIFISHRFDEVFELCDTLTVMRDGTYVATHLVSEVTVDQIVREMVGRDVGALFPKEPAEIGDTVLQVAGLVRVGVFHDIDLEVRSGEIVALAGLVGAGRSEVARAVFGVDAYDQGIVRMDGRPVSPRSPASAISAGMAFVPEDRRKQGLVMQLSVSRNVGLTLRNRLSRFGLIRGREEAAVATEWSNRLQVKTGSLHHAASTMSGGNQQKTVLAKWLATDPRLLIVDEPTRGIDVGTKAEVHRLMSDLAGQGVAILMISSELPEVLGMADRVLVMHEGRISAHLSRAEATPEKVMHAATASAGAAVA